MGDMPHPVAAPPAACRGQLQSGGPPSPRPQSAQEGPRSGQPPGAAGPETPPLHSSTPEQSLCRTDRAWWAPGWSGVSAPLLVPPHPKGRPGPGQGARQAAGRGERRVEAGLWAGGGRWSLTRRHRHTCTHRSTPLCDPETWADTLLPRWSPGQRRLGRGGSRHPGETLRASEGSEDPTAQGQESGTGTRLILARPDLPRRRGHGGRGASRSGLTSAGVSIAREGGRRAARCLPEREETRLARGGGGPAGPREAPRACCPEADGHLPVT